MATLEQQENVIAVDEEKIQGKSPGGTKRKSGVSEDSPAKKTKMASPASKTEEQDVVEIDAATGKDVKEAAATTDTTKEEEKENKPAEGNENAGAGEGEAKTSEAGMEASNNEESKADCVDGAEKIPVVVDDEDSIVATAGEESSA